MARIYSPLGTITGSVGNLTFSGKAGDNQIRQKIASNGSKTPAQVAVRGRFKLLAGMFAGLRLALAAGLPKSGKQSSYNRFVGSNYEATAYDPNTLMASLDYSKLLVAAGGSTVIGGS